MSCERSISRHSRHPPASAGRHVTGLRRCRVLRKFAPQKPVLSSLGRIGDDRWNARHQVRQVPGDDGDALIRGARRRENVHVRPEPGPDQSRPPRGEVSKCLGQGFTFSRQYIRAAPKNSPVFRGPAAVPRHPHRGPGGGKRLASPVLHVCAERLNIFPPCSKNEREGTPGCEEKAAREQL